MAPTKRAASSQLRVVSAADAKKTTAKPRPPTLTEAIESGSYLDILKAQRRQMATDVRNVNGPAVAALHRQIALTSKEIAQLEAAEQEAEDERAEVDDEALDPEAL